MTTMKQPFQCNLQPESQEPHRTTHTDTTTRCKTHRRKQFAHKTTAAAPVAQTRYLSSSLQPLYTEKHKVWCSGFLPKNIHAAITMRFAASRGKPAPIYARGNIKWRQWSSHSNAICNQRFKNRIELRTQTQPLVAKHIGGTIRAQNDRSHTRRTDEVPFIAGCSHFTRKNTRFGAPASSPKHSPCNIHAAITLRFAPLPFVTTSLLHHFPSSPLPFVTTPLLRHFPSSPLPFVTTSLLHHFPSSPLPFVTTPLHHHFPSSPLPFVTTSLRHHFPSSPVPFLTTSLRHHFPSSSLPFFTTAPSSPLPFIITSLLHPPCVIASYSFVMYCYAIYHPSSKSTA